MKEHAKLKPLKTFEDVLASLRSNEKYFFLKNNQRNSVSRLMIIKVLPLTIINKKNQTKLNNVYKLFTLYNATFCIRNVHRQFLNI